MFLAFLSHIRQNLSKNKQVMPKGSKIQLLSLDTKGCKNQKSNANITHIFTIIFKEKQLIELKRKF